MEVEAAWAIVRPILVKYVLPGVLAVGVVIMLGVLLAQRNSARRDRDALVAAITSETVAPDKKGVRKPLTAREAVEAVHALGRSKNALEAAVERQNAATETNALIATAAKQTAHEAAQSTDASLAKLASDLKVPKPAATPCPTSITADQWGKL